MWIQEPSSGQWLNLSVDIFFLYIYFFRVHISVLPNKATIDQTTKNKSHTVKKGFWAVGLEIEYMFIQIVRGV